MRKLPPGLNRLADVHAINNEDGYIVWRIGTGGNLEITHVKSLLYDGGTRLLKLMLTELCKDPPYHSVFGFTRISNKKAQYFYMKCGFTLSKVRGVYADGSAYVFSASFRYLYEKHLCPPSS